MSGQPDPDYAGTVIVRPSFRWVIRNIPRRRLGAVGGLLTAILIVQLIREPAWESATALVVACLWVIVAHGTVLYRARIVVTENAVTVRRAWGGSHEYPREAVAGIAVRTLVPSVFQPPEYVVVRLHNHHGVALLLRFLWPDEEINRLQAALGPTGQLHTRWVTPKQLEHEFPGIVPWWLRHYLVTGVGGTLAVIALGTWLLYAGQH